MNERTEAGSVRLIQSKGGEIGTVEIGAGEKKITMKTIDLSRAHEVGNYTLGAVDYLRNIHNYACIAYPGDTTFAGG